MPILQPVNGVSAPITGNRGVDLGEQGHLVYPLLQLERDLKANNPALAYSAEEIGPNRLDRSYLLPESGRKVWNGTVERSTGQFPLFLQAKDVQLKEGLLGAERAAELLLFGSCA